MGIQSRKARRQNARRFANAAIHAQVDAQARAFEWRLAMSEWLYCGCGGRLKPVKRQGATIEGLGECRKCGRRIPTVEPAKAQP